MGPVPIFYNVLPHGNTIFSRVETPIELIQEIHTDQTINVIPGWKIQGCHFKIAELFSEDFHRLDFQTESLLTTDNGFR